MSNTAVILYSDYAGKQYEKRVSGTKQQIEDEADRLRSLPDVQSVSIIWQ